MVNAHPLVSAFLHWLVVQLAIMSPGWEGEDHLCYTELNQCWPGVHISPKRIHLSCSPIGLYHVSGATMCPGVSII